MEVEEEEKEQFPIISITPQYVFSTTVIEKVLQQEMDGEVICQADMSFGVIYHSSPSYGENDYSL